MNQFAWIDTSFFYALFVTNDQHHADAQKIWKTFIKKNITGVTSNLIVSELGTLLVYNFRPEIALRNIKIVLDSKIVRRVYVDGDIETSALAWWKKFSDQSFSFPDCVSFEIMRRTGIKQALSFDCDFSIAGYQLVKTPYVL